MATVTERLAVVIDGDPRGAVSGLKRVGEEAGHADSAVGRVHAQFERIHTSTSRLGLTAAAVGFGAIAAGVGVAGFALGRFTSSAIRLGTEFQQNLNLMQAVTHSTGATMDQVAAKARDLGNDLSLPATSAADAAQAMVELAKGNLTAQQSMDAAKGTLQLAAAAQISGAQAATIQADSLNAFNLKANQAGHVADVLANAANAATGEISDFGFGLQASAAVAHQFRISLDDNVTALALFANAGIHGQDAGTSLKSALLALASPSKAAKKALKELGVEAFDAKGNFVGLRAISDELAKAHGRLSQAAFTAAVSTAFGSDAARAAGVLASQGATGFNKMAASIGRSGGAAAAAQAQMKGVGGAIQGLQSQIETVKIDAFTRESPHLEQFIRLLSAGVPKAADAALSGLDRMTAFGEREIPKVVNVVRILGPAVEAVGRNFEHLAAQKIQLAVDAVEHVLVPAFRAVVTVVREVGPEIIHLADTIHGALSQGLTQAARLAQSFERNASGLGQIVVDFAHAAQGAAAVALPVLTAGLHLAATVGGGLVTVVADLGHILGPLAGPAGKAAASIALVVVAVKGLKAAGSGITSIGKGIESALTKADQAIGSAVQSTTRLAFGAPRATESMSKFAGVTKTLSAGLPIVGLGIAAVGAELDANAASTQRATEYIKGLFDQMEQGGDAGQRAVGSITAIREAVDKVHKGTGGLFDSTFTKEFTRARDQFNDYQNSLSDTDKAQQDVTRTRNDLTSALSHYQANSPQVQAAVDAYNQALGHQTDLENKAADATKTATDRLIDKANVLLGAADSSVAYRQSQLDTTRAVDGVTAAQQALTKAQQDYGKSSPQARQATLDLTQARLDEETAARRQADAAGKLASDSLPASASAQDKARASAQAQASEYDKLAKKLGPNDPLRVQLAEWSRKLREVGAQHVDTKITAHEDTAKLKEIEDHLNRLARARTVDILADVSFGLGAPHHAAGGAVRAGQPVVVGENRREMFIPATNGSIRSSVAGGSADDRATGFADAVDALIDALSGARLAFDRDGIARIVMDAGLSNGRRG